MKVNVCMCVRLAAIDYDMSEGEKMEVGGELHGDAFMNSSIVIPMFSRGRFCFLVHALLIFLFLFWFFGTYFTCEI